jgi:hypothetical protein
VSNYERLLSNPAERDPLNQRINASLNSELDQLEPTFENWSAPQVKEAIAGLQRASAKFNARIETSNAFIALHPEFLDTESNGQAMNRTLQVLYGDTTFTPEHFEQAYAVLRANGMLDVDQAVIVQQEQAAADERAKAARERSVGHSMEELYEMDLEDLRRLDAIENGKRAGRR